MIFQFLVFPFTALSFFFAATSCCSVIVILLRGSSCFPNEVLERVIGMLKSRKDKSSVSLVCKEWYNAERWSRRNVFIGNCYSVSPEILTQRFPNIRSVTLKGKPRFSDFNLVPANWGVDIHFWLVVFAEKYLFLEELRLKRMTVIDESLKFLVRSFPNFKAISLQNCDGFSTDGLAAIAADCKTLVFLVLCVLFRLTCELQRLRFEGVHKLFEGCSSDASLIFGEHVRIRKQLWLTSHRYRFFIIGCLVTITVSQLGALLLVLASISDKTFFNSGDLLICSAVQLSGFMLCLVGAARITHRAQGIVAIATRWHLLITDWQYMLKLNMIKTKVMFGPKNMNVIQKEIETSCSMMLML
ncbi:hypothetical protein HN51_011988, partial [Arachis hypogaea]